MQTGIRKVGPASVKVRQTNAIPLHMRARTREVTALEVPEAEQRKGYATTLMHKVCREADAANIVLILWPNPYGDNIALSRAQLIDWYARQFGFSAIQSDPVLMARLPHSTPRVLALNPVIEALQGEKA
jgi:N-acetylglutamate synthase-like GNAT family acetyltransferase